MKRYLKLWRLFWIYNFMREMEYKGHFILNVFVEIAWTAVFIISLELLFGQTQTVAGWNKAEMLFLYGLYRTTGGVVLLLFMCNAQQLAFSVNTGELDLLLTKPINSLFFLSTRIVSLSGITESILGIAIISAAIPNLHISWGITAITLLIIGIIIGIIVKYCLIMLAIFPVFWYEKLENADSLYISMFASARFPKEAFPNWLRHILTFIIPIMFVATIPAGLVLGKYSAWMLLFAAVVAAALIIITNQVFKIALKQYSSASS